MQQAGGQSEPGRPYAPGYGIPSGSKGLLPWGFAEERMAVAQNYWIATVRPDGRPHLTPVWGVWVDGVFYFGSGPQTRKVRNLAENPSVAVYPVGRRRIGSRGHRRGSHRPRPGAHRASLCGLRR